MEKPDLDDEQENKSLLTKLKESVDDKEEQLEILSSFVRLGILVWSGAILTLAYVDIPKFPKQDLDPTFIASVFTGVLATFGVQPASKDRHQQHNSNGTLTKEEVMEMMKSMQTTQPPTNDRSNKRFR